MEPSYIVYRAVSPSGRSYIGCTSKGLAARKRDHFRESQKHPQYKFYRAIAKYGFDSFSWSVLGDYPSVGEMHQAERDFIVQYDSISRGYNITSGGQGAPGRKNTPEQTAKFSAAQRARFACQSQRQLAGSRVSDWIASNPELHAQYAAKRNASAREPERRRQAAEKQRAYASRPEYRQQHAEKARARYAAQPDIQDKISRSLGGRPFDVVLDGKIVGTYSTIKGCARELGLSAGNICSCLKGIRNSTGGYRFVYSEQCDPAIAGASCRPAQAMA